MNTTFIASRHHSKPATSPPPGGSIRKQPRQGQQTTQAASGTAVHPVANPADQNVRPKRENSPH
jgi:hypothetical protein